MAILTLITIATTIATISLSVIILPLIIASCLGEGAFETTTSRNSGLWSKGPDTCRSLGHQREGPLKEVLENPEPFTPTYPQATQHHLL